MPRPMIADTWSNAPPTSFSSVTTAELIVFANSR
uniref:Uncharacterized protein n=1 Tax=Arundo donax TaxID=35708 RepID=A0A0A9GRA4_ARUDO